MKIAVTATNAGMDAKIDPRFGRAAGFTIIDTDTKHAEYLTNEKGLSSDQGAGVQAAQMMASQGVQLLITGHTGPKATAALNAAQIKVYLCAEGTVQEALDSYRNDTLDQIAP